ncbi:MAG: sulfatase-like hydrolase/transferase [Verrucomicrobiota bacterium]
MKRLLLVFLLVGLGSAPAADRPDVLFIAIDDMNDWVSLLDPESPIKTPNLERLAQRGMLFTRAYCISAACNPSRAATMTGLRPTTTGVYGNASDWRKATPDRKTIMQRFQDAGYSVRGAGKLFHHHLGGAYHDDASFDDFLPMAPQNMPSEKLNRAPEYGSKNTDWGAWPLDEKDTIDFKTADYCIEALKNPPEDQAQFLACGIFKPHSPFFAPRKYHEGLTVIAKPERRDDDWDDMPSGAAKLMKPKKWFWGGMSKLDERLPGSYQNFIRAYAACCSFADAQIGRVLDALDASPRRDNTIVVLWSDHGFHLGEKDHIEKFALWEKSNHIPFIVVAPGVTEPGSVCGIPVDLSVLYPTLLELSGLPADRQCDGLSIVPLLKDAKSKWERPALMTYGRGNHAVRSQRWRYIRYADGTEELYDHANDPNEWINVAANPERAEVIAAHKKWLPKAEADAVPPLRKKPKPTVTTTEAAPRPNILLIVSEDNGPELGCYGEPFVQTPVLDKLAADGVLFERAYVPQAGCSQSRAAFLTGLYPHQNGQIGLATWKFRMYDPQTPNLVRRLREAGYRTGLIGKLHVNPESAFPFDFKKISSSNFKRKELKDYAIEAKHFITASDGPFFLSVNYPDAHRPFLKQVGGWPEKPLTGADVRPLRYFGLDTPELRQQTADYYNCMSRLDSQVGELLEVLRDSGKLDNTLIAYIGDHGADLLRGKRTSYEGGVRVPFILSWADRWGGGARRRELVSTLDLFPTFLAVAGAEPVPDLPGQSLLELAAGKTKKWRRYLFTEFHTHSAHNYYPQRTVRDERFKLIRNLMPGEINPGYAFTNNRFFEGLDEVIAAAPEPVRGAYLRMEMPPEFELYDLESDPYEFTNLAADPNHAATLARLQARLQEWRHGTRDPLRDAKSITRLKEEIEACIEDGMAIKRRLLLTYPDYFFGGQN